MKWLELTIRHPKDETEAVSRFIEKVVEQFHLKLIGNPTILWQGALFDKDHDCVIGCNVEREK